MLSKLTKCHVFRHNEHKSQTVFDVYLPYTIGFMQELETANMNRPLWILGSMFFATSLEQNIYVHCDSSAHRFLGFRKQRLRAVYN